MNCQCNGKGLLILVVLIVSACDFKPSPMRALNEQEKQSAFEVLVPLWDADVVFQHLAKSQQPLDKVSEPELRQRIDLLRKSCKILTSGDWGQTDLTFDRQVRIQDEPGQTLCPSYYAQDMDYKRSVDGRGAIERVSGDAAVFFQSGVSGTESSGILSLRLQGKASWTMAWNPRNGQRLWQQTDETFVGTAHYPNLGEWPIRKIVRKYVRFRNDQRIHEESVITWKIKYRSLEITWKDKSSGVRGQFKMTSAINGEKINMAVRRAAANKVRNSWE